MPFETLDPTQGFKRAEVALYEIVDGDKPNSFADTVASIDSPMFVGEVRMDFPRWRFLDIVRRQPGGLWSDKIIEVSPRSSRDRAQESAIIRR